MENSISSKRIKNLKNEIESSFNISNILIFKDEDIFYLTNFYGKNSNSAFLITENKNYLFVNFIYFEEAKNSQGDLNIEIILYKGDKNKYILEVLKENSINELLMQSNFISYYDYAQLENLLKESGIKSKSINNPVGKFRLIKEKSEQDILRMACKLTDESFSYICSKKYEEIISLKESVLAIELEKFLLNSGGTGKSFDFIIANNSNSSKPHYSAQYNYIKDGLLLMDYGVLYNNYCSDITRTVFIGKKINSKLKEIYKIVSEAQLLALNYCKEGIKACELDKITRNYISEKGYKENFGHSLGHGVGIEIHEPPWINEKNEEVLREGMVITIEPGIYIENLGGVRIEDMVIVRKNGCENLYKSSKEIIQIY
ncbi:MAG: aminopeptidase P family protein [Actinobacteria bacterium]|nr:aminopeptidase P family protein [Actinomycetota bacterium]